MVRVVRRLAMVVQEVVAQAAFLQYLLWLCWLEQLMQLLLAQAVRLLQQMGQTHHLRQILLSLVVVLVGIIVRQVLTVRLVVVVGQVEQPQVMVQLIFKVILAVKVEQTQRVVVAAAQVR